MGFRGIATVTYVVGRKRVSLCGEIELPIEPYPGLYIRANFIELRIQKVIYDTLNKYFWFRLGTVKRSREVGREEIERLQGAGWKFCK
ncbi:MAG: hypothetical protein BIFFINMI_00919 [Phycisphaerae bacterium]|nr:hypothetical protein [Phycisphaerae bacterium]